MPLSKAQKEKVVASYGDGLAAVPHAFLVSLKGMPVPQVTELRRLIRERGGSCEVVRNRLAKRSVAGTPLERLKDHFSGPTAVVFARQDVVALAKVLTDFAKEAPLLELKGGVVEAREVGSDDINSIANLPTRDELIANLLFL
jgi:large subunit ribosomal protein L10